MKLYEKEIQIPRLRHVEALFNYVSDKTNIKLSEGEVPIRFAITKTTENWHYAEVGILANDYLNWKIDNPDIFSFNQRAYENTDKFNVALVVPTGIGAELGGHSGDAGALARLMASACDTLITHPNVVNASDINELPENGLYVEGSVLSSLFMGTVGLQKVRSNRVLLVTDSHTDPRLPEYSVNAVSATRVTMGLDCPAVVQLQNGFKMISEFSTSGRATGRIEGLNTLFQAIRDKKDKFDAVAISSVIQVPERYHQDYYIEEMVNPWGGAEALLTHAVSIEFNVPSAHSPMMESQSILNKNVGIVDPRMSAEVISVAFLHCVLKGLQRSPRVVRDQALIEHTDIISAKNISCLVIPDKCVGLPTLAAIKQGIPVIAVRENDNIMQNKLADLPFERGKLFIVDNYLEALGVMGVLKVGITLESIRRPIGPTIIYRANND